MHNATPIISGSILLRVLAIGASTFYLVSAGAIVVADDGALEGRRHRIVVSSDIGGTDPDDVQSMVHLLIYADSLDIEGLVSSPYGQGRKEHIMQVIDAYGHDLPNLKTYSDKYPTPDALRALCKQGAIDTPGDSGVGESTEGSDWIIQCAKREDSRPLNVLVWGGIDDLAQALRDAPEILPKLRVYFIGGPNKKWSVDAYNYIEQNHPYLWIIEANATYRGWFVGGNQKGEWNNKEFVAKHIAEHGALGDFFVNAKDDIKMGDTPSVARLLHGTPEDPSQPGWGGKYVPIWDGRKTIFDRLTTEADTAEVFGVTEFALPKPDDFSAQNTASMIFDGGVPASKGVIEGDVLRFRFSPRDAKVWSYVIKSDFAGLDGKSGKFEAVSPPITRTGRRSTVHPNWWIDDPDPAVAEGVHPGAKSVNRWREDFLRDFAGRMDRCQSARSGDVAARRSRPMRWGSDYLKRSPDWYKSAEAQAIAENVLLYQSTEGAWPKNVDMNSPATPEVLAQVVADGKANTIDNDGTTVPMRFLALMADATNQEKYKKSFVRGLDYLFAAQYDNGGWPQFFPLRPRGYYSHITYNDDAMMSVMFLLREVAAGQAPYTFVDEGRRDKAAEAVRRGIDCILKTQIKQDGKLTVWCAQHDEVTLAPAWARNYEPPTLSGSESVGIVRFLMDIEDPTPDEVAAIEGAVAWFEAVAIHGLRYQHIRTAEGLPDGVVVVDPSAGPLWARFYEIGSNRPVFTGRDRVIHYSLDEIERERRGGYAFYGNWAASLLAKDYPRWQAKHKTSTSP
ncbi:pectate lyase [Bythopirellula polymerisocia]|uniref:Pectic acid lyase n=1 Tax=Bythopirellula polymerisocia TaxID=2528003 RepID=A0A5C6D236_9BACT|nr:pectate lyase [Bythopirellula polymerisocia]TWU29841.1 Pectic acid lyase [Bythopirellula polymerisocia]